MSKYEALDKAILKNIEIGCNTMTLLDSVKALRPLIEPHRVKDRFGHLTPEFRVIDRRLQAMRKAGTIRFINKAWEIVK